MGNLLRCLLSLMLITIANTNLHKQERTSPLLPDFKPFKHPSEKLNVESGPAAIQPKFLSVGGPISQVDWLDFVPVFGRIYRPAVSTNKPTSTLVIIGCLSGLIVILAVYFTKADSTIHKQKCDSRYPEEVRSECFQRPRFSELPTTDPISHEENDPARCVQEQILHPALIEEEIKPKVIEQILIEETVQVARSNESFKTPTNANLEIKHCPEQWLDEPNFSRKIKTFKLVKEPKTCQCESIYHGLVSEVLSILEVMEFERTEKLKSLTRSVTADFDIEGANISRLRITAVRNKDEDTLIAKTMTVKEYMTLEANKKIEEAMALVKQNCSVQNIKNLADTIKKYRPEPQADQNTQSI